MLCMRFSTEQALNTKDLVMLPLIRFWNTAVMANQNGTGRSLFRENRAPTQEAEYAG
jgi:hypothetical protein